VNLGLAATTFAIVIPAELPDKTFISAVILSSRHRPLPVWGGTAAGLLVQAALAVVAGRALALAPQRVVEAVVAAAFLAGAAYLLLVPERSAERAGAQIAEQGEVRVVRAGARTPGEAPWPRVALSTFALVVLAELGDLTQVVIANLAARSADALSVFVGAAVAFVLVSGLGVATGRSLVRVVPLEALRKLSGLVLLGFGVWSALRAA
jgi:putative Ca2+/H+ antiporter (TMEM165/GDT1 family)